MAMSPRGKQGGATRETPLNPQDVTQNAGQNMTGAPGQIAPGSSSLAPGAVSGGIQRGTGADWFGPLNPMEPTAPPQVAGRIWDMPSGYNLSQQPRAYNPISFSTLRGLAESYDLLRIIIETRKDEMERLQWTIAPRDPKFKIDDVTQGRIKTLEKFFLRPDRVHFWGQWLRMLLEDLFVIDAPSIYKRRTRGGDLYSLEIIDGTTIKPVVDDWGRTPEPPIAAYQQALKGFPAVNYSKRDLLYMPRNVRANQVYGYGPVEQILMTINIGLRRQVFQLNFFTEGNMPAALIGTPETWTPDQIRQFQDWFDGMLDGDLAQRRKAKFVPSSVGKTYQPTQETELFGAAEEWLARVICFAFSISPQAFTKQMNRATAETAQESAAAEGLLPTMNWVRDVVNTILIDEFDEHDLEFKWIEEDEIDPKVESEIITKYVEDGILSVNSARSRIGEDAIPDPAYDRLMVKTATGYVPFALTQEEQATKDAAAAMIGVPSHIDPGTGKPKLGPDGKPMEKGEGTPNVPPPVGVGKPGGGTGAAAGSAASAEDTKAGDNASPGADKGTNAAPEDDDEVKKSHQASIKPIERAAMRPPGNNDAVVSFGAQPGAAVVEAVLNAAGLKEPNWR